MDAAGHHSGGPFRVDIALKMRIQDLRRVIMVRTRGVRLHDHQITAHDFYVWTSCCKRMCRPCAASWYHAGMAAS